MDVDGTLTDGKIYVGETGEICKAFHVKDGYGIREILIPKNCVPIVITGRKSKIVENRCKELDISEVYQGIKDKKLFLHNYIVEHEIELKEVAYIGDDDNDLDAMLYTKAGGGIIGCPADASWKVISVSNYVCRACGGNGAVREFIEYIIK